MNKFLCILFLSLPVLGFSQQSNLGNWLIYFGNTRLNKQFNWHHEVQYRNYDAIGDLEQLLIRTGIGYNLTENNHNVLLGYAFIHSQNYAAGVEEKVEVNEHRIYQQYIARQNAGRVGLQHRYRFEQRFIEDVFKLRLRYFLGLTIPLNHREMVDKTWYLSMYNEVFLNTKDTIFDRNRLYGGLGYRPNKRIRFEAGYMNQFLNASGRDQVNLIVFLQF